VTWNWNYRILRTELDDGDIRYGLHEVHYTDKGNFLGWIETTDIFVDYLNDPGPKQARKELKQQLKQLRAALKAPALSPNKKGKLKKVKE
jgi:hypothetical protein